MSQGFFIVKVSASFAGEDALSGILKKYSVSNDDVFAYWDEFAFTASRIPEADAVLVLNDPLELISIITDPGKVIAFMMEPGEYHEHPWMFKGLERYAQVFSPLPNSPNTVASHGFLGWQFAHDYHFLKELAVPEKTREISCIASKLKQLKGHRLRTGFVNRLSREMPGIDMFGRGTHYLPDKLDGLLSYRYSIAIENASMPDLFTEKINDCFLAYTVPIYYGCTNLGKYFPEEAFVWIDITQPEKAIGKIKELMAAGGDWDQRLPAIQEAREKVLNAYQPLAGAASILRGIPAGAARQTVLLQPTAPTIWKRIKTAFG